MADTSYFEQREDIDGVRASWNALPRTKLQHERNIIPFSTMYTPLNNKSETGTPISNQIVNCRQCQSFINPYVAHSGDNWVCSFCGFTNRLVADQEGNLHQGLSYTTIEYETNKPSTLPPIFIYVIDTCFESDDVDAFDSLKESLTISLSLLPEDALVGVISFGKNVAIHNLANNPVSYAFNGGKEYTLEEVRKSLGILDNAIRGSNKDVLGAIGKNFLQPINLVEYEINNIIENLVTNTFPRSERKERMFRSVGSALNIASLLLTAILGNFGSNGGNILCFIGGACTHGPGSIVSNQLKDPIRSHHDIEKEKSNFKITKNIKLMEEAKYLKAKSFYATVTQMLVKLGVSCNFFIGSYDQVGLYEMDELCRKTGGVVIMTDSFNTSIFKQSFLKYFKKLAETNYLEMALNATLEVKVQSDLKVQGVIGNCIGLPVNPKNANMVSPVKKGEGNTNSWKLCQLNPQSSFAIFFDKLDSSISSQSTLIQYITHYQHASGQFYLRVTTFPVSIIHDNDIGRLEMGFDQDCAVVSIARDAVNKLESDQIAQVDVVKGIEKTTVDFCSRFAQYTKGNVSSFMLSNKYAFLPHFIYHLRRSPFISVFNSSPDETSFVRHILMHEDTNNSLIMIQPTLLSYNIDTFGSIDEEGNKITDPEPVLLDSVSLSKSSILLLDTFFQILIYHGEQIAQWRKLGYHEQEEYAYFKEFLEAPKKEAMEILIDRFPLPRFIDCDEGGSQARFLMAKLNPSSSYSSNPNIFYGNQLEVLTDDLSMQLFMDHIQRIVTAK